MTQLKQSILGIWRLQNAYALDDSGNKLPPPFGEERQGLVEIYANGRMVCVQTNNCADLLQSRSYISFEGAYSINGNTISTLVDASSDSCLLGSSLVREVSVSDTSMTVSRPPVSINGADVRLTLVWEKLA